MHKGLACNQPLLLSSGFNQKTVKTFVSIAWFTINQTNLLVKVEDLSQLLTINIKSSVLFLDGSLQTNMPWLPALIPWIQQFGYARWHETAHLVTFHVL